MKYLLVVILLFVIARAEYNESLGKFLGQLTVASYCGEKQINSWTCPVCKNVSDMKYVHVFKNRTNDTCGYIAVNEAEDAVGNNVSMFSACFERNIALGFKELDIRFQFFEKKVCFV